MVLSVMLCCDHCNFTLVAHRRVRSAVVQPRTHRLLSEEKLTYYSCSALLSATVSILYHKCLRFARHFGLVIEAQLVGGDEGARTPDLDSAIVALSQLSYIPEHGR